MMMNDDDHRDEDGDKDKEWDVIVGVVLTHVLSRHFLGVDHIGHRYGIDHPEMSRKIAKMDEFLERMRRRAREIKEEGRGEVLLLFFGDHGQTTSGDHGGATREEVCCSIMTRTVLRLDVGRSSRCCSPTRPKTSSLRCLRGRETGRDCTGTWRTVNRST